MSDVIEIAKTQIGTSEEPKGSNWGEAVEKYLRAVSINFPAPWCAAFVVWCHKEAGVDSIPHTGGVLDMWNKAYKQHAVLNPQPGDVFIQDHGGGNGHAGIVESVNGQTINTIEGNTNDEGSREGYEVARRTRPVSSIKGFLRFS
ncbi:CHAP domain-containing protein [Salmonella enterica]|nr:CHAP domain-containing protein [Salmonella enterica]